MGFKKITESQFKNVCSFARSYWVEEKFIHEEDFNNITNFFHELKDGELEFAEMLFNAMETHPRNVAWEFYNAVI